MFLKIRDTINNRWWYVNNVDRLVVDDPILMSDFDPDKVDFKLTLVDVKQKYVQIINCITDVTPDDPQREYKVVFTGPAYLCKERGQTMQAFIPNPTQESKGRGRVGGLVTA